MRLDSPEADLIFTALGNKIRRRMLQRLSEKPARSISELAREFEISSTAASNQIKILEQVALVARVQRGKYSQIIFQKENTRRIMHGVLNNGT